MDHTAVPREGTLDAWEANADVWSETIGHTGNRYWRELQLPCLRRLIKVGPRCKALDLATGTGLVAQWLASEGANVVATDGSERMLEHARALTPIGLRDHIAFHKLDVTQGADFRTLGGGEMAFDAITMNMAIMDIETLEPLAAALPKLLAKDGVFVSTMLHPVFFTSGASQSVEVNSDKETGRLSTVKSTVVREYLQVSPWRGVALDHQPVWQLYFHRPLHELLGVFFRAGLVMDAIEEPTFRQTPEQDSSPSNHQQVPVLFAFRLKRRD